MVSITSDYTLIEKLIRISKNAGDAIMDVYETEFDFDIKSNQSPVTKADLLSNKIICSSLKKITPDIPESYNLTKGYQSLVYYRHK